MKRVADLLAGVKALEEVDSVINGRLVVKRDLAWGTYIQGGGITQSGGVLKKVWMTALKKIARKKKTVGRALIVGLGGGSVAMAIEKNWSASASRDRPGVIITGIEIDNEMIRLGKKYLGLDDRKVKIVMGDGYKEILNSKSEISKVKYDLVCVDTYVGDNFPEKFERKEFLERVGRILAKDGVAVFNRLYYGEKRALVTNFEKKLMGVFGGVERIYPQANVMLVCTN